MSESSLTLNLVCCTKFKRGFLKVFLTRALRLGTGVKISFSEDLPSLETKRSCQDKALNCLYESSMDVIKLVKSGYGGFSDMAAKRANVAVPVPKKLL